MSKNQRMRILGVPVDMVTCEEALSIFRKLLRRNGFSLIVTPNSEIVVNAGKDSGLLAVIEDADLVIPDGIGLVYASRILKNPLKERVTGIDFLTQILSHLQETGQSIFLLGGKPGVAEKAAENMQKSFPGLRIAGTHHGYYSEEEEPTIAWEIDASGASFLCAALGSPKQELFMKKYASQFSGITAGMGVGGSLDVWAGNAKRAPAFYQRHGLEWLYRFAKQPSRAGRMLKLPVFMIKVLVSNKQYDNWEEKTGMNELEKIATNIRVGIIKAVSAAGSGHPGGSLSAADIVTALYFKEMNIDPENPGDVNRDKFILSKGHAGPAQYAALAERGFFPKEELETLRKLGSNLQGHPDMKKVPGVEMSTGSLGQGFAAAGGMALANKLDKLPGRIYTLLGDGELQEGIVWEAAMSAAHYGLDNLVAIVDWNGLQIDGPNDEVMKVTPIHDKFAAFGWNTIMIDGHDFEEILDAFEKAGSCKGKPTAIIAKTIKGKGVSFMENNGGWHGKAPTAEEAQKAICELGGEL